MDPTFGLPEIDPDTKEQKPIPIIEAIDRLLSQTNVGGLKSSATRILMRETYDSTYQLYAHSLSDGNILASILLHDSEDCSHIWGEQMEKFAEAKIGDLFHISFPEFMKQPKAVCDQMIKVGMKMLGVETRKAEKVEQQIVDSVKNANATRHTGGR